MMEVQDRLEVKILEAKDISFEGSRPNCFVELQVGPDRRRSTVIPEGRYFTLYNDINVLRFLLTPTSPILTFPLL